MHRSHDGMPIYKSDLELLMSWPNFGVTAVTWPSANAASAFLKWRLVRMSPVGTQRPSFRILIVGSEHSGPLRTLCSSTIMSFLAGFLICGNLNGNHTRLLQLPSGSLLLIEVIPRFSQFL